MKRSLLILVVFFVLFPLAIAQSLTDAQVLQYAIQEKKSGASETEIATRLLQRGATMSQIQRMRQQYAKQINERGLGNNVNAISSTKDRMRVNNETTDGAIFTQLDTLAIDSPQMPLSPARKRVFGRDIFNNNNLSFEPQMNIATPQNYVLGPGDQLIVDIYGATQESMTLTVSPDGDVTIPDFGPVHVSGLSVSAAQSRIHSRVGNYYSSSEIKALTVLNFST